MIPGLNPRKMAQAMKRMGIQQTEIEAKEVIIKLEDKELVFQNPQVSRVNMMGQETFQIIGNPEERSLSTAPEISEDDIKTVMDQTQCSEEEAKTAIEEAEGDLAQAILNLKK
ncbi:nascent polypeptide-associated complex protein [Candidatus Woesearchaeota archaeon]|nr:nascent polypeptide-associated complex protein [Candidatus Woesearchaeota archaeon]